MIGVSPAYFLSRFGPGFGPAEIVSGLPYLAASGYKTYQQEVFLASALPLWTKTAIKTVIAGTNTHGLQCNIFVAHFLGAVFSSGARLSQGLPLDQIKKAISIASTLTSPNQMNYRTTPGDNNACSRIFVLPLLACNPHELLDSGSRFQDLLGTLITLCRNADLQLALELVPGNILGGSTEFLSLVAKPGFSDLGLLFDTGHFWAMGEQVHELPRILGKHILATHLCDNDGLVNESLCPGDGTIPFPATIKALEEAGYAGSLDLEIVCSKDAVETEYRRALIQFKQLAALAPSQPDCVVQRDTKKAIKMHIHQQAHKETII